MKKKRVVITGMGVVSPIGNDVTSFWRNLLAGKSGIGPITHFDASDFPCQIAAEVKEFDVHDYLRKRQADCFPRVTHFACAGFQMAINDANLQSENYNPDRMDVILGTGMDSFDEVVNGIYKSPSHLLKYEKGVTDPLSAHKVFINSPSCAVALLSKARGYVTTVASSCTSACNALGLAVQRIQYGEADLVLSGGFETPINRFVWAAFDANNSLINTDSNFDEAVRPFDKQRKGYTFGEGGGLFILEEREHAVSRGAKIYAEITGFSQGTENVNEIFANEKSGNRWAQTIRQALNGQQIDYINAHAPGDMLIDAIEVRTLQQALGEIASQIPISSIKGAVGSGLASANAFQIAATVMALHTGQFPPCTNYENPDPDFDLSIIRQSHSGKINTALVNSHALGGINSVLVLKREDFDG